MKKKICGIYKITNPNGKVYIGQSVDVKTRWLYHKKYCKWKTKLSNSINKYGASNHLFEILEECSRDVLDEREVFWIDYFNCCTNNGLNCKSGGKSGKGHSPSLETREKLRAIGKVRVFTEEHRKNISIANKGRIIPDEVRKKISQKLKGVPNGRKGIFKHSPESNEKNRLSNLGKTHTQASKEKVSASLKLQYATGIRTRIRSEETKQKIRNWMKDNPRKPMLGKTHSIETKAKMSETKKKMMCIQLSLDGFILNTFDSLCEAAIETGCGIGNISLCMQGKRKRVGNFIFC